MKRFPLFLVVIAVVLASIGAVARTSPSAITANGSKEIDTLLQRAVQQGVVPGVVAMVATKDKVLYEGAFGLMDVAKQKPMQKDTIFRIASMTKPVTSVAVMMLVEEGKLSLDDPVSKYIPSFKDRELIATFNSQDASFTTKKATKEVLIRHLLTNTSGLAYTFANDESNRLQRKLNKPAEELPLLYEPGTRWTYSGSTRILGLVVEKITGMGLDKFYEERIFKPLKIQETSFVVPDGKTDRVVTTQQRRDGKFVETANPAKIQSPVAGDGGLNATAADYIKFLQMFLNEGKAPGGTTLLRKASIEAMTKNEIGDVIVQTQLTTNPALSQNFPIGAGRDKFGFGFQLAVSNKENPDLRSPGSYTWAGIYNTHFWVDPKRQIAGVIMMQVLPFYDESCMKLYQDVEAAIGRNLH
jgi:CubicO group peptidase (beta-lactamase class C family)